MDLELTAMRKDNTLRTFRLSTGREDWGVMSTEHYLKVVSVRIAAACDNDTEIVHTNAASGTDRFTAVGERCGGRNSHLYGIIGSRNVTRAFRQMIRSQGALGATSRSNAHPGLFRVLFPQISSTLGDATESGDESSATGIESSSSVAHATNTRRRAPGDGAPMPGRRGTSGRNIISGASSSGGERQPPAIDVLKRLIHVNRKAYASRKEVAIAMQEVLDRREMSSQVSGADAAPDSDGERGRGEGAGGKQKQGGEQLEEELDFITIKKEEAKVVSLVR